MARTGLDRNDTSREAHGLWEDLVIAMLSVNQYSLERTYSSNALLREQGLFEPENLARWGVDEICERLCKGGCNRGSYMSKLFAVRLACLGDFIAREGVDHCVEILMSKNIKEIERLLIRVKGIGPKVLANFFLLRGIDTREKNRSK
jgi:hypothetical protein